MADNTTITAGSGTTIATDDISGIHYQRIKLTDGTADSSAVIPGDATNGLDVDVTRVQGTVTVAGNATVSGTITSNIGTTGGLALDATLTGGTAKTKIVDSGGTTVATVTAANALKVDNSAVTQPVSGSVTANIGTSGSLALDATLTGGTQKTKIVDSGGTTVATVTAANALKVDNSAVTQPVSGTVTANVGTTGGVALDATLTGGTQKTKIVDSGGTTVATVTAANALKVDGSAVTQPVSGTVTTSPPSNASTNVAQLAGTATDTNSGTKSAGTLRVVLATDQPALTNKLLVTPDANSAVNCAQVSGTAIDVNSGNKSAGTQRVVLATDQPALTNPLKTTQTPATTGGLATFHLESAASTNATNIKASAGQVFGWYIYNSNAAARKVAFHNASGTPTAGASIFFTVVIPAGGAANVEFTNGIAFSTGIAITTVTGLADSNSSAVAADDLNINVFYA